MSLVKHLTIDDEVEDVLRRSVIAQVEGTTSFRLQLPEQLDRKLYDKCMKLIEAEGGKWVRQTKAHLFTHDPRERLGVALEAGVLDVLKEGWFPTPAGVVGQMLDLAPWEGEGEILEPSAGEGAIAEVIRRWDDADLSLLCVERNAQRAQVLRNRMFHTLQADFLSYPLPAVFSRIYMNPPFEQGQDIVHTMRAYELLRPEGELVGIMSVGPWLRQDRQAVDFQAWFTEHDGEAECLPEDAFKSSGTGVSTRMVHLIKE